MNDQLPITNFQLISNDQVSIKKPLGTNARDFFGMMIFYCCEVVGGWGVFCAAG